MEGDAKSYITSVERAKRALLLEIDSDPNVPELERQIAIRAITAAVNDIVLWKTADAEKKLVAMIRRVA